MCVCVRCISLICLIPLILHKRKPPECVVARSEANALVGYQENQENRQPEIENHRKLTYATNHVKLPLPPLPSSRACLNRTCDLLYNYTACS